MVKGSKRRASSPTYSSPNQLVLSGFESPFERELNPTNRWVRLAHLLPWDDLAGIYHKAFPKKSTGRPGLSSRVVLGSMIIKHMCNLDDRETVEQISENIYMQYFLGYSSFSDQAPFDASLFVEFRKRLGKDQLHQLNELVVKLAQKKTENNNSKTVQQDQHHDQQDPPNSGTMIVDATVCPQDISYPTDVDVLNDARLKSEILLDIAYQHSITQTQKPRNYRKRARKDYLHIAQKKNKSKREIRKGIGRQLGYLGRNIRSINKLLDELGSIPFDPRAYKSWLVIQHVYDQQLQMHKTKTNSVENRIVSVHQPHVRPMVRGKSNARVEFGAKINVALVNGLAMIHDLEWDAFNEGNRLQQSIMKYRATFGYNPKYVLADKIYCSRENRKYLKDQNIILRAKPLGRPSVQASQNRVRPGERNPIEGKFGQAKTGYGMNRIMARLPKTSEAWIACIILVLNLVKLAEIALYCIIQCINNFYNNVFQNQNQLEKIKIC